jgi:shikimate kinase
VIVLVGFMGAGKSSVGSALAEALGLRFVDTDVVIAQRALRDIPEIFDREGEEGFRAREREVATEALSGVDAVVSLGGGAVIDPHIRELLASAMVVHLDVGLSEALRRVGDDDRRPMLQRDPEELYRLRDPLYREVADLTVPTDGRSIEEITRDVTGRLSGAAR